VKSNSPPPLVVRFEKAGRGGKVVTLVVGLTMHPDGKTALLSDLKKKLGTGGAVKNGALELQGDQRERLPPLLTALGYKIIKGN
jgi:translation initiation factor 1